jgi:hypothetical protein
MMSDVKVNLQIDDYTNRVLGVIKEKFGLKDKGQALDKFTDMFGDEFVEKEVKDEVVNDVIASCEEHIKKHGFNAMSDKEFKELFGV